VPSEFSTHIVVQLSTSLGDVVQQVVDDRLRQAPLRALP
jgi:hypothetical protein